MAGPSPSASSRFLAKCCKCSRVLFYPALHRLEQQGWIKAKWAESETGRRARFYTLTAAGRKQLATEAANWTRLSAAIDLVMGEA